MNRKNTALYEGIAMYKDLFKTSWEKRRKDTALYEGIRLVFCPFVPRKERKTKRQNLKRVKTVMVRHPQRVWTITTLLRELGDTEPYIPPSGILHAVTELTRREEIYRPYYGHYALCR